MMKATRCGERVSLPPTLSSAMRRAAVYQVGVIAGFETLFVLGALSAQRLSGTELLFGISPVTLLALGQLVTSLPAGKWMDRWGRKPVLLAGASVEALGLFVMGVALLLGWSVPFVVGLLLLGLGSGAAQLVYLLGGDLYPPHRRGEGLSLMSTFTSVGAVAGPYIVGVVGDAAEYMGMDPVVSPWFVTGMIVALVAWVIAGLHPEPLDVSREPGRYFQDLRISSVPTGQAAGAPVRSLTELLRVYPIAASVGLTVCFQGVRMSILPLLALIVRARGYSLTAAATMVAAMGFGMMLASYPIGRLGDRWGRRRPLLLAILIALVCTAVVFWSESLFLMFGSLVLLGSAHVTAVNMSRAVVTDVTGPEERGVALSTLAVAIGVAVIVFPTIASYVLVVWGWRSIAVLGGVLLGIALILVSFLREQGVGRWDHNGVLEGAMGVPVRRKGCGEPLRR